MTKKIYHSPEFVFKGVKIPSFELEYGKIIKLCLPNFDGYGNELFPKFKIELLNHFDSLIPKIKWSKKYYENKIQKILNSLTVEDYIIKELNGDIKKAEFIAEYLDLGLKEKVKDLIIGKEKSLIIKCDFENHNILLFDYYGVGNSEIKSLEHIVESEISKGKSAIVLDRLDYNDGEERSENINRIKITVGNNT